MENIIIRQAKIEELPDVQRLNKQLFEEELSRDQFLDVNWPFSKDGEEYFSARIKNEDGRYICLVAVGENTVVGYLAGSMDKLDTTRPIERAELENTLVKTEYRGQGIGGKLFKQFTAWAKEQGAKRLVVRAYSQNDDALKFYEKQGFAEISKVLERDSN